MGEPELCVDTYTEAGQRRAIELSLSQRNIHRAARALARRPGELEVLVRVVRPDGVLIVSSSAAGCVASFQAEVDGTWVELVGDVDADRADEVEVMLGGLPDTWSRRYVLPLERGRQVVAEFATNGSPPPGRWEDPRDH